MTAKHLRLIGAILLLAGLVTGPIVYFTSPAETRDAILGLDIRTNRQRGQLERMGGKHYVMLKDLDDWFGTLWHGRRLGCTIGVLSALGFLICRGLARVHEDYQQELADDAAKHLAGPRSAAEAKPPSGAEKISRS